jgi:predicted house-cleaning noncanonical NTP pyrophosphatase (MazG superfamily)
MKIYNKLVRDRIPEIMRANGAKPKARILANDDEYRSALLEKLVEEAKETLGAKGGLAELVKEIGDVTEVISAIVEAYKLDWNVIEDVRGERLKSRGGFEMRIFLESEE